MKLKMILCLAAAAGVLRPAQGRAEDTNVIPSLTIDGQTYKNVELGAVAGSRVTLFYDGGGQRVAISNLPAYLQERLHYDPEAARLQDAAEAKRVAAFKERSEKEAEAIATAQRTLGPAQKIRLVKILADNHAQIEVDGVKSEAYIPNLPAETLTVLREFQNEEAQVTNLQHQLAAIQPAPAPRASRTRQSALTLRNEHAAASESSSNRSNVQAELNAANKRLDALKGKFGDPNIISARPSAFYLYPHIRQWLYEKPETTSTAAK